MSHMRYWIRDQDETPQRFPLQRLLRRAFEVAGGEQSTCEVTRARGYGLEIRQLEQQLDVEDVVHVSLQVLDRLSEGSEEWFYELDARVPGAGLRFGLHDSTALFVEGDAATSKRIVDVFTDYCLAE